MTTSLRPRARSDRPITSTPVPSIFDKLPGEIRNQIWELCDNGCFEITLVDDYDRMEHLWQRRIIPLTQVNTKIRSETLGLFESQQSWRFATFVDERRDFEKWAVAMGKRPLFMKAVVLEWILVEPRGWMMREEIVGFRLSLEVDLSHGDRVDWVNVRSIRTSTEPSERQSKEVEGKMADLKAAFKAVAEQWASKREQGKLTASDIKGGTRELKKLGTSNSSTGRK